MKYDLLLLPRACKELQDLPRSDYERIRDAIRELSDTPRGLGRKKLSGREGWRIRVGTYRVVYEINDQKKTVTVLHIGHRKDVYR